VKGRKWKAESRKQKMESGGNEAAEVNPGRIEPGSSRGAERLTERSLAGNRLRRSGFLSVF
jgi:hypothetical protein